MAWYYYVLIAAGIFVAGYLVGSNNPYAAAKKRLLQKGAASINKILGNDKRAGAGNSPAA